MKQLVEWGKPAIISGRIYNRGCIKLPDLDKPVDIILHNSTVEEKYIIGKANLIENEIGIYVDNIKWFVDIEKLDKILLNLFENDPHIERYTIDLTIAIIGYDKKEYTEKDSLEFSFVGKHVNKTESIKDMIRDLKLCTIIKE